MACETAGQIQFFNKNKCDLEFVGTSITITDAVAFNTGQAFINYLRDRKNYTAWMTTDSTDAAGTVIDINYGDFKDIDSIFLLGHNLKDYKIEYWTGLVWSLVTLAIDNTTVAPTNDTNSSSFYYINSVNTDKIKITINGTQIADADKRIQQLITTTRIGKIAGWPVIKRPTVDTNKKTSTMLSGKKHVVESLEAFSCSLDVRNWNSQADLDIIEEIYFKRAGVLLWLNSDRPDQFAMELRGYRKEDLFLVRPSDAYSPEFVAGLYKTGVKQSISLVEVIT